MTVAPQTITVRVPLAIRWRASWKVVVTPDGAPTAVLRVSRSRADPTMVTALARAFRCKRLLQTGKQASIIEIAAAEEIDRGYEGGILNLTLLAPNIVKAILDEQQPADLDKAARVLTLSSTDDAPQPATRLTPSCHRCRNALASRAKEVQEAAGR